MSCTFDSSNKARKFLAILNELFLTRRIYAESRDLKPPRAHLLGWTGGEPAPNAYLVGYADDEYVYLLLETATRAVNEVIREQRDCLDLEKNELLSALAREGLIDPGKDGKHISVKTIQAGEKRVICLPRRVLGHDEGEG